MTVNAIAATARSDFTHHITDLADEPDMTADELKAYFDSGPQELLDSHNALVAALTSSQAAADIGFAPTEDLNATSIQQAIVLLQTQINALKENT
jgi:hypothetical protein